MRVILAQPRGLRAGVVRAIGTVERALAHTGQPVHVRHRIVRHSHAADDVENKGAHCVSEIGQVKKGAKAVAGGHVSERDRESMPGQMEKKDHLVQTADKVDALSIARDTLATCIAQSTQKLAHPWRWIGAVQSRSGDVAGADQRDMAVLRPRCERAVDAISGWIGTVECCLPTVSLKGQSPSAGH